MCTTYVWTLMPGKEMATAYLTSRGDATRVLDDARAVPAAHGLQHATVQVKRPGGVGDCSASW
jgi:cobalt-zinc-cadmium efflux system protein